MSFIIIFLFSTILSKFDDIASDEIMGIYFFSICFEF